MLRFPPKVVGILCSFQVLMIIGSMLICRTMLKVYNTARVPTFGDIPERFTWLLSSFLLMGPWLLLIPLSWGIVATAQADMESRVPHVTPLQTKVGYGATLFVLAICCLASLHALNMAFGPAKMINMTRASDLPW
jgi:hypothetical protein